MKKPMTGNPNQADAVFTLINKELPDGR